MPVLQPVIDGHFESPVPYTLTGGAPMDAAMSNSHQGVQPEDRLHFLNFGSPQLHQAVAVPYGKDCQSLGKQEVHRKRAISKMPRMERPRIL